MQHADDDNLLKGNVGYLAAIIISIAMVVLMFHAALNA